MLKRVRCQLRLQIFPHVDARRRDETLGPSRESPLLSSAVLKSLGNTG